jgi:hypothetical protein
VIRRGADASFPEGMLLEQFLARRARLKDLMSFFPRDAKDGKTSFAARNGMSIGLHAI